MNAIVGTMTVEPIAADRTALDWRRIGDDLDAHGCAVTCGGLSGKECASLSQSYREERLLRSRIVLARYGFGRGEYKYLSYPKIGNATGRERECQDVKDQEGAGVIKK